LETRRRLAVAIVAVAIAFGFQALTVRYNYNGNWTGLFCIGGRQPQPPDLGQLYQFPGSFGYDGQFYRLIAHDPWISHRYSHYIDNPRYRYSRILVPALAYLLAGGHDRWIDPAYLVVNLVFLFLGVYWTAEIAQRWSWSAWTGLLFLTVPATIVSIDRLTIDLAMAALCVGYIALRRFSAGWFVLLAVGGLCRDIGFLLILAACLDGLRVREYRRAGLAVLAAAPGLLWLVFEFLHTSSQPRDYLSLVPLAGFASGVLHPYPYSFAPAMNGLAQALDYLALPAVPVSLWCLWRLRAAAVEHPELLLCALPLVFVNVPEAWVHVYAFGRTMSPFWIFLALRAAERRFWYALLPLPLLDLRIGLQLGDQLVGIARGLLA
jgi:hypothetical protein